MPSFYEFLLLNVDFGLGDLRTVWRRLDGHEGFAVDKIEFQIEGRAWLLRKCVECDYDLVPIDVAAELARASGRLPSAMPLQPLCVLQVQTEGFDEALAGETADDICWLLRLALGRKVAWSRRGIRHGVRLESVSMRAVQVSTKGVGGHALSNFSDQTIKRFLERAHPIFVQHAEWWRVTLDWFAFAQEAQVIQVTGLIASMLLDRVTKWSLAEYKFPKQIDEQLKTDIEPGTAGRKALEAKLDALLKAEISPKWNQTNALVEKIREWNNQPSYPKKIGAFFGQVHLPVPARDVLDNRHTLAHDGELKSAVDGREYYLAITEVITALLLKLLGYSGKYYVLGTGEKVLGGEATAV